MVEIVFFDVETTVPIGAGERRFHMVEFGAVVVCPRRLVEIESYSTLIRPFDLSAVAAASGRTDGITREVVSSAPRFEQVADHIFRILNGRVWGGHNIQRFDCARIREAFADIGRPAPEPIGMIDSLAVLMQGFGRRAGNLKMATLASYFGLGQQKHRSLDDVRMNLEVLKHSATVLLLESSLPNILKNKEASPGGMVTRSRSSGKSCAEEASRKSPPITLLNVNHKSGPYTRSKLRKVTEGMKELLHGTPRQIQLNNLVKQSRSLLR